MVPTVVSLFGMIQDDGFSLVLYMNHNAFQINDSFYMFLSYLPPQKKDRWRFQSFVIFHPNPILTRFFPRVEITNYKNTSYESNHAPSMNKKPRCSGHSECHTRCQRYLQTGETKLRKLRCCGGKAERNCYICYGATLM